MSKKLIAFNWKMYPKKLADVEGVLMAFDGVDVDTEKYKIVVAPPAVYLSLIANVFYELKADIWLALQNCAVQSDGALTGEISAEMGRNVGADYAIIGHSERRIHFGETEDMIGKKVASAVKAGLIAILCVGEPLSVRKKGKAAVKQYIRKQLDGALREMKFPALQSKKIIVAYEPVWAIGTGVSATTEDAVEVIDFMRTVLAEDYAMKQVRIIYGGSINGENVAAFVGHDGIDGALIGGASVDKKELKKILKTLRV